MENSRVNGDCPTENASSYDLTSSIATNVVDGFTMVAVGDLIVSRALTKGHHPGFGGVVDIVRGADAAFGNLETLIFDIRSFNGSPAAEYGGAYHISLPDIGPDLRAIGFNIVGRANNHAFDWGVEGMRETSRILDHSGIVHAGVGENRAQASAARFLETARGRVGLLSCATSFTPMSRACDPAGEAPGRPGLNALRLAKSVVVRREMLATLRQVRDALPNPKPDDDPEVVVLEGTKYRIGEYAGYSYDAHDDDIAQILRNVRSSKQFSDFCIFTNHAHQPGNWSQEPAEFERLLAHKTIDAGADAYVGHGPHQLRGIEIYKGRPIFYSLGNFIMDDLRTPVGADMFEEYGKDLRANTDAEVTAAEMSSGYASDPGFKDPVFYESIVTVSRFDQNQLTELRLYPIELGHSMRLANRGVPRLASPAQAKSILERLQKLSNPFGTDITIENGVGFIRPASELRQH
ncbi:CapA family protein [Rhizobium etli]|uniref:CapA family protein n=1 Tax=Rhizobium etli TaxID=29449 RepID=UPI0003839408|nr:CapA family protein [Rhizobium etli]AGS25343.1 capsule synthesis CapA-like protein [Rhizobium etli bv. mimosae str. Mim1]